MKLASIWLIVLAQGAVIGCVAGVLAQQKGYSFGGCFALGFFFSLVGLLYAVGLPRHPDQLRAIIAEGVAQARGSQATAEVSVAAVPAAPQREPEPVKPMPTISVDAPSAPPVQSDAHHEQCPRCGLVQVSGMRSCFQCGLRFERKPNT